MYINIVNQDSKRIKELLAFLDAKRFSYTENNQELHINDLYYINIYPNFPEFIYKLENEAPKLVSRINNYQRLVVNLNNIYKIGEGEPFFVFAGPCSIENKSQIDTIALSVSKDGAKGLRGGAFKPRTSPYSFQGLGRDVLQFLSGSAKENHLVSVSEITSIAEIPFFEQYVDVIQVGARNMQNFELLKALGKVKNPILLKRGFGNTIEEFILSAEYIASYGNPNIILCERGIRTFEGETRNTLDMSSVALLKRLTNLPIIIDPSHATGNKELVKDLIPAIVLSGADGMMIEVHNNPRIALSDGEESLDLDEFKEIMEKVEMVSKYRNK